MAALPVELVSSIIEQMQPHGFGCIVVMKLVCKEWNQYLSAHTDPLYSTICSKCLHLPLKPDKTPWQDWVKKWSSLLPFVGIWVNMYGSIEIQILPEDEKEEEDGEEHLLKFSIRLQTANYTEMETMAGHTQCLSLNDKPSFGGTATLRISGRYTHRNSDYFETDSLEEGQFNATATWTKDKDYVLLSFAQSIGTFSQPGAFSRQT